MTPRGGKRKGAGRPLASSTGKRVNIYLAADLLHWWESMPSREKSEFVNQAIREKLIAMGKG